MTTLTPLVHDFGTNVGVGDVEQLLAQIPPAEPDRIEWTIDLSAVGNVDPGAGFRLGNALRAWSRGRVRILVPDPGDFSASAWFQTFTRSGLGLAVAAHAHEVRTDARDVTAEVHEYYRTRGNTGAPTYAVRAWLHNGALVPNRERFASSFNATLAQRLRTANERLGRAERTALVRIAHEAVTNVVDHAFRAPGTDLSEPVSYLSLRWYRRISSAEARVGSLREYLARRPESLLEGERIAGWLELVVDDDGIGIPARHTQDLGIYQRSIAEEDQHLLDALHASRSVKLETRDAVLRGDPGFGMTIIAEGLRKIGAYAALRTGRRLLEFDPTVGVEEFIVRPEVLGVLPGTAWHVVLPVREPQLVLA